MCKNVSFHVGKSCFSIQQLKYFFWLSLLYSRAVRIKWTYSQLTMGLYPACCLLLIYIQLSYVSLTPALCCYYSSMCFLLPILHVLVLIYLCMLSIAVFPLAWLSQVPCVALHVYCFHSLFPTPLLPSTVFFFSL